MDDVTIVHLAQALLTTRMEPGQGHDPGRAEIPHQAVLVQMDAQAFSDQPGRHAIEHSTDLTGAGRVRPSDRGKPLAGKSTLNRLELTPEEGGADERYKKTVADFVAMDALLVEVFLESYETAPGEIILDVDATDDPVHGHQAGRFFHGYYRHYCYLPLYIFCGEQLLCARLLSVPV